MDRAQAMAAAQSAVRLRKATGHRCTGLWQLRSGAWQLRQYGWTVTLWDSGTILECVDDWGMGR